MPATAKKLGKLSLAILENFVKSKLGEDFVKELRSDYDEQAAIVTALTHTEERFFSKFPDRRLYKALFFKRTGEKDDVPNQIKKAVADFFTHPTSPTFPDTLTRVLKSKYPDFASERVEQAVAHFVTVLTEELALADEDFREKARALADLHGEKSQQELVEIMQRVEALLAKQTPIQPVADAAHRAIHQLRPPPADFIQRPKELDELRAGFADKKGAAISGLTGLGGIGKTVLGLFVAHELAKDYPDAQIFLDLKGTSKEPLTPADAMRHVLLSFDRKADLRALDEAELAAAYSDALHAKKALLFWDNARSAEQVKPLLPPPSCAALITSRWQFPLPGLKSVRLGVMKDNEAKAFLLELCPRIGESAPELARRCGCLPLALRIAGSFLALNADWSLPEYLERLQARRLQTLRSADDAELDLETVFDESYQSLREEERQKWRTLAVFPASFDRPAAAAVWNLDEPSAHDLLSCFCRYSLLDFLPSPPPPSPEIGRGAGGEGRYSLHDLLAEFGRARSNREEQDAAHLSFVRHFVQVLESADELYLRGSEGILHGLRLLDTEWPHILAAQTWASEHLEESREIARLYSEMTGYPYCLDLRLTPHQRILWLEKAVQADRLLGDRRGEGNALGNLGNALYGLGEKERGIALMKQALAIYEAIESLYAEWARNKLKEWGAY